MTRNTVIAELADMVAALRFSHPVRVGIDGVDASGKTTLANELITPLVERGREVIRVSVDGFHNPRTTRQRQGRTSPRGYYEDSFNYDAIIQCVLQPLGPGGNLQFKQALFDFRTDKAVESAWQVASLHAILLFEGVFLHRVQLRDYWDFSIFVDADFDHTLQRAQERDRQLFGSAESTREMYLQRYIPGQQIYLEEEKPRQRANVVFRNNEIHNPELEINKTANTASHGTGSARP
jgi:uridine kinase